MFKRAMRHAIATLAIAALALTLAPMGQVSDGTAYAQSRPSPPSPPSGGGGGGKASGGGGSVSKSSPSTSSSKGYKKKSYVPDCSKVECPTKPKHDRPKKPKPPPPKKPPPPPSGGSNPPPPLVEKSPPATPVPTPKPKVVLPLVCPAPTICPAATCPAACEKVIVKFLRTDTINCKEWRVYVDSSGREFPFPPFIQLEDDGKGGYYLP